MRRPSASETLLFGALFGACSTSGDEPPDPEVDESEVNGRVATMLQSGDEADSFGRWLESETFAGAFDHVTFAVFDRTKLVHEALARRFPG